MNKIIKPNLKNLATCFCGHWYNTSTKCPICKTVASYYHFTTSEKIKILTILEWICIEGIWFDFEEPTTNIISYNNIIKNLKNGVSWWCRKKTEDSFIPLIDAWDLALDKLYIDMGTDEETVVLNYIRYTLLEQKQNGGDGVNSSQQ